MKYLTQSSFSVGGYGDDYSKNWEATFGKKKNEDPRAILQREIDELESSLVEHNAQILTLQEEADDLVSQIAEKKTKLAKITEPSSTQGA